jgi:peroxiredoxin
MIQRLSPLGLTFALAISLLPSSPGRAGPPTDEKQKEDEVPKGALVSPGPDTGKIVEFLKRIKDGRTKAERDCGDILIRGRFSEASADWKDGMAEPTPEKLPPSQWYQFLLVHKGEKRRYDAQWANDVPGSEFLGTYYALSDGKAFYSLKGGTLLEINDRERQTEKWRWETLASGYFRFGHVHDGLNSGPVDVVCQTLIDRIAQGKNGKDWDFWKGRVVRCYEKDGLLVVENDDPPGAKSRYRYRFWVDPKRGYHVVRLRDEQGGPGQPVNYRNESRVELAEAAPGVFLPKRVTNFFGETGTVARRDGRAGWSRCDMETDSIKTGTIKYVADLLELGSLPVPKDVRVIDYRGGRVKESGGKSINIETALLPAGKLAPAFDVPLLSNGAFKSKDVLAAKKHVLVTFWSFTCPPCAAELTYLNEIHGDLRRAGIEAIAVNVGDEADEVRKFVKDRGLKLPVGLGGDKFEGSEIAKAYGVHAIPTTYLISPGGTVSWRKGGFDKAELNEALKKAGYAAKGPGN